MENEKNKMRERSALSPIQFSSCSWLVGELNAGDEVDFVLERDSMGCIKVRGDLGACRGFCRRGKQRVRLRDRENEMERETNEGEGGFCTRGYCVRVPSS